MADFEHEARESLVSTICDFLVQTPVPGALLLTGDWGAGKSTFYRNRLEGALRSRGRTPVYLSVAGASTIYEIEERLFAAVHPFSESVAGETISVIWKSGLKFLKVDPKDIKFKAQLLESMVVCIDDLERFDGKTQALFGFVQNLLEEEKIPCLLVGAEEKIGAREAGGLGQQTYGTIREKIVAKSLHFSPSILLALEALLDNLDKGAGKLLRDRKSVILDVISQDEMRNIRSLGAAIRECGPILAVASEVGLADDRMSQLLGMALAAIFEARRNNDHATKIFGYLAKPLDWLTIVGVEREDDNPVGKFLRKYANLKVQSWPAVPAISEYLSTGIFNSAAIRAELELIKAESGQTPFGRLIAGDILELTDEQFAEDQDSYYAELRASSGANLAKLVRGASSMAYLADLEIARLNVVETLTEHKDAVLRHSAAGTLDVEDYSHRLSDEDALRFIRTLGLEGEELARVVSEAVPIAKSRQAAAARARVLQLLLQDFDKFAATVFDPAEPWRHIPLFVEGDANELGRAIAVLAPSELGRLREFLRWRGSVRAPSMAQENQLLTELAAILRERARIDASPLRRFGLLTLVKWIEHVVETAMT